MSPDRILSLDRPARQADDDTERGGEPTRRGIGAGLAEGPTLRGRRTAPAVTVREVGWHHLAAVALREALAAEMLLHSADRLQTLAGEGPANGAGTVAYTGVAFTQEGLPVGHAALRWNDDDVELHRVYVTPSCRGSGTAAALLAAAEEAARGLHVRRIILRTSDQQPDAVLVWERAGYTPVPGYSPHVSGCLEKVITGGPPEPRRRRR